jgi:hypothetical protein
MGNGGEDAMTETNGTIEKTPATTSEAIPPPMVTLADFRSLVGRAMKGDRNCLPQIRAAVYSGEHPEWSSWLGDAYGNPARWLKNSLASGIAAKEQPVIEEAAKAQMDQLRTELEGPAPTPIEALLAERAALCWFMVNTYETLFSQSKELSIGQAEFHLRKIDSAHKRFLSAVATLARVRKLALPTLQVNIGKNQVNVAGSG